MYFLSLDAVFQGQLFFNGCKCATPEEGKLHKLFTIIVYSHLSGCCCMWKTAFPPSYLEAVAEVNKEYHTFVIGEIKIKYII